MRKFRFLTDARFLVAIALVAASIAIFVASMPKTDAVVFGGPNVCAYYSDATYHTVVGARGTGCCGAVINWGVTTQWKKCQVLYCTDQICPN